jgi:hypothetical protein
VRCLGFDIETVRGIPYILSLDCQEADFRAVIELKKKGAGLLRLMDAIQKLDAQCREATLAGAHFMRFDLGVLVYDYVRSLGKSWKDVANPSFIDLSLPHGDFHLRLGNVVFATLKTRHSTVTFVDTASYFPTSLDRAAASINLEIRKLEKPVRLGMVRYSLSRIAPYAQQDARIVAALLRQIVKWWGTYGILPAISAPQMSARVFTHSFVKRPWVKLPRTVNTASLLAYHGGKNGFYRRPGWYYLRAYDIRSAYPWAMTQIPPMVKGQWTWYEREPKKGREEFSFVLCAGVMPKVPTPVFYSHDFVAIKPGERFERTAVTGMEYRLLKERFPRWKPESVATVIWEWDETTGYRDLKAYAEEMYQKREQTRGEPVLNALYKLLMNSLYGKFIARTPQEDGSFMAGQLFYPAVASWITALVRTKITRLEWRSDAVHTSTDGFMTERKLSKNILGGIGLGSLKLENEGWCLILRNKLYLHFDQQGKLNKYALHGFQGNYKDLWEMVREGRTSYTVNRLLGWREARRAGALPFAPVSRVFELKVPEIRTLRKDGHFPRVHFTF